MANIAEVEKQLAMADKMYEMCMNSITKENISTTPIEIKQITLSAIGTTIELYLKGLALWKVCGWNELRHTGHDLKSLYNRLDEEGKNLFKNLFESGIGSSDTSGPTNFGDKKLIDFTQFYRNHDENIQNISLRRYDYVQTEHKSPNSFDGELTEEELLELFRRLNLASARYANYDYNFTDREFLIFMDVAKNLRKLANMARSESLEEPFVNNSIRR